MKKHATAQITAIMLFNCLLFSLAPAAFGKTSPKVSLGIRFDNVNIQAGKAGERYMEILLQAPEGEDALTETSCPPMNIALVIDRSGSMQGEGKMGYVKEAARAIIENLRPRDRIALISYDNKAEVIIPLQPVRNKKYLLDRIYNLYPRGATNLGDGLLAGYREISGRLGAHSVNRVILLSDGLANRGITSARDLSAITAGNYAEGISLSTLGVGAGFNEDLMTTLAMDGGGMYYYIDRPSRIPEIMARELSSMQSLVASNINLRIELSANIGIGKVIGNRYQARGRSIEYNVGELSVGERRRYMVYLDIPELSAGGHTIGKVRMQYTTPGQGENLVFNKSAYLTALANVPPTG